MLSDETYRKINLDIFSKILNNSNISLEINSSTDQKFKDYFLSN